MGGKSRKTGGISKALIDKIKQGNIPAPRNNNDKELEKETKEQGFDLFSEDNSE